MGIPKFKRVEAILYHLLPCPVPNTIVHIGNWKCEDASCSPGIYYMATRNVALSFNSVLTKSRPRVGLEDLTSQPHS